MNIDSFALVHSSCHKNGEIFFQQLSVLSMNLRLPLYDAIAIFLIPPSLYPLLIDGINKHCTQNHKGFPLEQLAAHT